MRLVVGLPRSQTAWLSVFLSQSGVKFYHEAINGCYTLDEYKEKIKGCGDCTTAIDIVEKLKPEKVVIIEKDDEELKRCIEWCNSEYNIDSKSMVESLNRRLSNISGLRVKQSEIGNKLKEIWEYLVDSEWDESCKDLLKFNIQVKDSKINEEAAISLYESFQ